VLVGHELLGDGREAQLHRCLVLASVLEMERRGSDERHKLMGRGWERSGLSNKEKMEVCPFCQKECITSPLQAGMKAQ
jgi:hypothetical protein